MGTCDHTPIFILGMHRSGASALANILHSAGVSFGDVSAGGSNASQGAHEHSQIAELHEQLLTRLGSSWDDPCRLPDGWWNDRAFADIRAQLAAIIDRDFSSTPVWALKDPRLCRLLPIWTPLLEERNLRPKFVLIHRNPVEIAAALTESHKFPASKALLLWLEYVLAAERETRSFDRLFLSFEDCLQNPVETLGRLARALNVSWPHPPADAQVAQSIDLSKRHHRYDALPDSTNWASTVYSALDDARFTHGQNLADRFETVGSMLDAAQFFFAPEVRASGDSRRPAVQYATALASQITQLQKQWKTAVAAFETTKAKLTDSRAKLEETRAKLEDTRAELKHTRQSFAWKVARPFHSLEKLLQGKPKQASPAKKQESKSSKSADKKKDKAASAKREAAAPPAAGGDIKQAVAATSMGALRSFLASGAKLTLPTHSKPQVSILLVLFNRAELTFACLRSLAALRQPNIEVIIVDNASTDETPVLLMSLNGATVIRNTENVHFLEGTNQAARAAKGDYLLLLNNDTQVLPNSIEQALRTLQSDASIGAVGAKLILPDGQLQEAGSIVWQDGSCLGYGRGKDPMAPEFQFQRDVDFCSGAFLLTPRDLFMREGGFLETFKPAYYEETDYCMRLWQWGYRVVYDPCVAILHYEFASSKTSDDAIALQVRNKTAFQEQHAAALADHHLAPSSSNILAARSRDRQKVRVLYYDDQVPHPHLGGGFPRAHAILTGLVEIGCFVTMYPALVGHPGWSDVYSDIPRETEVMLDLGKPQFEDFLRERKGYYQYLLVSRPHNMKFVQSLLQESPELFEGMKIVYDAEALFSGREIRKRQLLGESVSAADEAEIVAEEISLVQNAHAIIAVNDAERQVFASHVSVPCFVLGHALPPSPTPACFSQRSELLFVGSLNDEKAPNADSLFWFEKEIFPLIRKEKPLELAAVGQCSSPAILALNRPEFQVLGAVRDLTPFYNKAKIFIAPTRFAAGIPMKVHEAAAFGVPVVCTSLIAQQLGWTDGKHLLVADDPESFARKCLQLHADQTLWETLRQNALEQLALDCARDRFIQCLRQLFAPPH